MELDSLKDVIRFWIKMYKNYLNCLDNHIQFYIDIGSDCLQKAATICLLGQIFEFANLDVIIVIFMGSYILVFYIAYWADIGLWVCGNFILPSSRKSARVSPEKSNWAS